MPDPDDLVTVHVDADLSGFRAEIDETARLARGLGTALASAFEGATVKGRSLSQVLQDLALRLSRIALAAALRPLEQGLSAAISGALSGLVPAGGGVKAFARGGVIGQAGLFAMPRGGLGLAGEAGPEAILPLARGPDGRLGVASGGAGGPVTVVFNVQTPDVEGFRRARGQIAADLGRLVERGLRHR